MLKYFNETVLQISYEALHLVEEITADRLLYGELQMIHTQGVAIVKNVLMIFHEIISDVKSFNNYTKYNKSRTIARSNDM